MRHLHYFDPQLVDLGGHYFNYCEQAARQLKRRGIGFSLYARKSCSLKCCGVAAEPVFSHDIFKEAGGDPEVWALENFNLFNRAFLADLLTIPAARFTAEDVVFFPSAIENQLYGFAQWLGRIPEARRPACVVLLRFLNRAMDFFADRPHADLIDLHYRFALRELLKAQPRTILAADTEEMAGRYGQIAGIPVHELPVAMEPFDAAVEQAGTKAGRRPTVVFQGHTSPTRGFLLLPEIVERCAAVQPRPRFVVQVQDPAIVAAAGLGSLLSKLRGFGEENLRLVCGSLSPAAYFETMAEADIVLLPYSPKYYGHCSSGIFAEAAAMGKIIVVPAGTVSARLARKYALGVAIASAWGAPEFAEAVAGAVRMLPVLSAQARAAAPKFRQDQSAEAFWDRLIPLIDARQPVLADVA